MTPPFDTYIPDGFGTVSPYIMVDNTRALIDFLKTAFEAEQLQLSEMDGRIANCILKIGTTCFMVSQTNGEFTNMKCSHYVYVSDVDAMYTKSLAYGAKSVFEPQDIPYNDRQAGITDPSGNYWWISARLVKCNYQDE